jgi:polyferredoxin
MPGTIAQHGTPSAERESTALSTLNANGSRRWLCPRPSRGRFWRRRRGVAYALIAIFTLLPYLKIASKPVILLDIVHRQFTLFGATFLPTDAILLALLLIGVFIGIFLATAVLGRVWCGWACPQTVYMEFVFRPLERLFEGEPGRRKPLFGDAAAGKAIKFIAYTLVSMVLAHTFLAYFVGVEELARWVRRSPLEHPTSFLIMLGVTGLMLFDFGFFREQMCIVACPYGRLQSVMLDRSSLVVGYDRKRGEPRGKAKRPPKKPKTCCDDCAHGGTGQCGREDHHHGEPRTVSLSVLQTGGETKPGGRLAEIFSALEPAPVGDCVDCRMCVNTCPTGIDIRNGLQMECIACAQCIDACDAVMTKLGRPTGLIRYATQAKLEGERPRRFRPRLVLYPMILLAVGAVFVALLAGRSPADLTVVRGPGLPFNELPGGMVSNQVKVKLTNRTATDHLYRFEIDGADGAEIRLEPHPMPIAAGQSMFEPALIVAPRSAFQSSGAREITVRVTDETGPVKVIRYRLLGPFGPAQSGDAAAIPSTAHTGTAQ